MRNRVITGGAIGLLTGIPWLVFSIAGGQIASLPVPPFNLFEILTRALPGGVITSGIEFMVRALNALDLGPTAALGKRVEMIMAFLVALAILTLLGSLYAISLEKLRSAWVWKGILAGLLLWGISLPVTAWGGWGAPGMLPSMFWLLALSLTWGMALAWGVESSLQTLSGDINAGRGRTLAQLAAGAIVLSGGAILLSKWVNRKPEEVIAQRATQTGTVAPTSPSEAGGSATPAPTGQAGFVPVTGTREELTPIRDFYRVDINLLPPGQEEFSQSTSDLAKRLRAQGGETEILKESYVLSVEGLVEKELLLDLTQLKNFPKIDQYATLTCISNPVGGDLISTTLFSGARLKDVLQRAGLKPGVVDIKFTSVDGYTESLPIESALDKRTLLCYAMDNQPLTQDHGAPIRLYTPNRFGMKNPKWIIKIEAINEDYRGYWEKRGWSEQAWVQTTSVIDAAQPEDTSQILLGGIAFAGARGIQAVQVRLDEGDWVAAELDNPLSPLTWVLWRANLDTSPGSHQLTVRAIDGTGEPQTPERSDTHPDGATGYYMTTINV